MLDNAKHGSVNSKHNILKIFIKDNFIKEKFFYLFSFLLLFLCSLSVSSDGVLLFWRLHRRKNWHTDILNIACGSFYCLKFLRIGKDLAVPECAHEWFPPPTPLVLAGRWSLKDFCQQVQVRIAPRSDRYQAAFPSCWAQQNKPASEPDLSFSELFHVFCLRNHSSSRAECLAPHESCQT